MHVIARYIMASVVSPGVIGFDVDMTDDEQRTRVVWPMSEPLLRSAYALRASLFHFSVAIE